MNMQRVATKLRARYGVNVRVGNHRRIEDIFEDRESVRLAHDGYETVTVEEEESVPMQLEVLDGVDAEGKTQTRMARVLELRKITRQKTMPRWKRITDIHRIKVGEIVHEEIDKFTRDDGQPVQQTHVDEAVAAVLAEPPEPIL